MRRFYKSSIVAMTLLSAGLSASGDMGRSGGLGASLESADVSARDVALGSASVGFEQGSASLFANPAGLAALDRTELGLHHNSWLVDSNQETFVVGQPLGQWGGLGLAVNYMNFGSFDVRDASGSLAGSLSSSRYGLQGGWGSFLMPGLELGLSSKFFSYQVGDSTYSGYTGALGALYRPAPSLGLAMAYNMAPIMTGSTQASSLRVGASWTSDWMKDNALLLTGESILETQGSARFGVGVEDQIYSFLSFRAGYNANSQNMQMSGFNSVTLGLGLSYHSLVLDYAYLPYGDLGTSQQVSLTYGFGDSAAPAPVQPPALVPAVPEQSPESEKPAPSPAQSLAALNQTYDQGEELEDRDKNNDRAMATYRKAIEENGGDERPWRALGRIYYKNGEKDLAVKSFDQVLALNPNDHQLKAWLKKYMAAEPGQPPVLTKGTFDQGEELEDQEKLQAAMNTYRRAVRENSGDERPWRAMARIYFKNGEKALTISCFEEVLKLNPNDQKLRAWVDQYKAYKAIKP